MRCVRVWCVSSSVVSNFLWPHGLYPSKLLCPWHFPGKNTGMGCLFLVQGTFMTQELDLHLLHLLHCRQFFTSSICFIHGYIMDIVLLHIWVYYGYSIASLYGYLVPSYSVNSLRKVTCICLFWYHPLCLVLMKICTEIKWTERSP